MSDDILKEINDLYPGKMFLTLEEVAHVLGCEKRVIYNWGKKADPQKRPPRIVVGKTIRYPKVAFVQWLVKEQAIS